METEAVPKVARWGDYWERELSREPVSDAAERTGLTPGTAAWEMYQRYDTGRVPVPELPTIFHLHYMIHKGRPRWVMAMRASYVCNGPRCRVVTYWETRPWRP